MTNKGCTVNSEPKELFHLIAFYLNDVFEDEEQWRRTVIKAAVRCPPPPPHRPGGLYMCNLNWFLVDLE